MIHRQREDIRSKQEMDVAALPKKENIQRAHVNRDGVLTEFDRMAVIVARG